jgi:hypothetical protein
LSSVSKILGYEKERGIFQHSIIRGKAVFISGEPGIGKSYFVDTFAKENGFRVLKVPLQKINGIKNFLKNAHTTSLFGKNLIVFDGLEDFIDLDKRNSSKNNVQEYIKHIIKNATNPVVVISYNKGNPRSKDKKAKTIYTISEMCTSIQLRGRDRNQVYEIVRSMGTEVEDTVATDQLFKKSGGNPRKLNNLINGVEELPIEKDMQTWDLLYYASTEDKEEAFNYIMNKPESQIPTFFLLNWTSWNADKLSYHDLKKQTIIKRLLAKVDVIKYRGVRDEVVGTVLHVLPKTRPPRLESPKNWGVGGKKKEKKTTKKKVEPKRKFRVRSAGEKPKPLKSKARKVQPQSVKKKVGSPNKNSQRSLF